MRILVLLAMLLTPVWCAEGPDAGQVQSVYLLPMANGLDQYLANQLIAQQVYQVVTDPKLADAVLTDQIGASFETKLAELYPPEKTAEETSAEMTEQEPIHPSSFGRGKGNLFLVDVKSRRVLWSGYELAKSSASKDMRKTSEKLVERLRKAIQGK